MKQTLFEFSILHHKKEAPDTVKTVLLVHNEPYLAVNESTVKLYAAKQIPAELDGDLDNIEIVIRKF